MTVKRLMSKKKTRRNYVTPDYWISTTLRLLQSDDVGALIVSSDGLNIIGIISERDIVRELALLGPRILKFKVSDLMTEEVVTCKTTDSALSVMQKMDAHRIRHIPVMNSNNHFEGIISIHDVLEDRIADMENETNEMRDYITGKAA